MKINRKISRLSRRVSSPIARLLGDAKQAESSASSFAGRCAFWNSATLSGQSSNLSAIRSIRKAVFGRDVPGSMGGGFIAGEASKKALDEYEKAFQEIVVCVYSPQQQWRLGVRFDRIPEVMCAGPELTRSFAVGKLNWCLCGLELTDCPLQWIEAAKEASKDFVFVSINELTKYRMTDVSAFWVKQQFEGWDCLVYDVQKEAFTDASGNVDALMSPRCSLLFFRVPAGTGG